MISGPSNCQQKKRQAAVQEASSEDDGHITMAQKKARLGDRLAQMYPDSGEYLAMVTFRVY